MVSKTTNLFRTARYGTNHTMNLTQPIFIQKTEFFLRSQLLIINLTKLRKWPSIFMHKRSVPDACVPLLKRDRVKGMLWPPIFIHAYDHLLGLAWFGTRFDVWSIEWAKKKTDWQWSCYGFSNLDAQMVAPCICVWNPILTRHCAWIYCFEKSNKISKLVLAVE